MKLPSLTIFVPNLNHGRHLPACVASVLSQSVLPTELILLDDGSTDDSVAVMESLARQSPVVKVYRNERNLGVIASLNRGLDLATGDYFLGLAADDSLLPGVVEKMLQLLVHHPQAAFCGAITLFRDEGAGLQYLYGTNVTERACYMSPDEMVRLARAGRMHMFATPMMVNRQQLIANGKYFPELKWCTDWFAVWTAGYQTGVCHVPEVLGEFTKDSTSYSGRGMQNTAERFAIYRAMLDHLARPKYQAAARRMREGAVLAQFGKEMLWLVLRHREYRHFLTPVYFWQACWWSLRAEVKKILPASLSRLYFRLAGHAPPRNSSANTAQAG
jgi:glycosyltransferase involved in cell wall biosynthesis